MWQDSELVRVCRRVHDRTWNQGLSGCVTRLGTGQILSSGLEFERRRWEFECRRLDLVSIGSEFVSVVHKGVMRCNNPTHLTRSPTLGCSSNTSIPLGSTNTSIRDCLCPALGLSGCSCQVPFGVILL